MKRAIRWRWFVFFAAIMTTALPPAWGAAPAAPDAAAQAVSTGYLENVTFERLPGKERVALAVSKQSGVTVENQPGNVVLVRMENLFVPFYSSKPHGTGFGLPIAQLAAKKNQGELYLERVPEQGTKCVIQLPAPTGAKQKP